MRAIMARRTMASWLAGRCVVAGSAAVLACPGEGPLGYPAAGQNLEGVPVALAGQACSLPHTTPAATSQPVLPGEHGEPGLRSGGAAAIRPA
jgi:hypothetical protein